ncbi:MFS transporter [Baekduia soli]|uniref:MFS transporter n=1 Tax=Baekduia soli TaxID=496014 RepID=A0A5B8U761_9ACTN|nr:MFS transporter [Baekduia soli]QEC48771.1 MFS transporter [Baekduia soli]
MSPAISGSRPDVGVGGADEGGAMHSHHHPDTAPPAHAGGALKRLKRLLLLLCVAQLMVILDISAVNVAMPDMARSLGIAGGDLGWTITSYSLIFGSLLLLGGRAADLLGRRRMFLTGLGVFVVASLAAATAGSPAMLFSARAGQGLGAAMLSPAALSILMGTFREGTPRAHALAAWGAVGGAGAAVGVLVGGALTELVGWQAIFVVNLPIGLALGVAARRMIPADTAAPDWHGLDLRGAALASGSSAALVFALSQAADAGWTSAQTLGLGGSGLAGLAAFVAAERRTARPLLRLERLADRGVGGGLLLMLVAAAALFGTFLLVSLYLQDVLDAGPLTTGLAFLPLAVALGLGVHAGNHVLMHAGVRMPMAAGFAATAGGMVLLSGAGVGGSYLADVLPGMLVAGVGLGVVLVCVSVSVMTGAEDEETGMLSGLTTTGHEIGGTIGVAVLATIAAAPAGAASPAGLSLGLGDAFVAVAGMSAAAGVVALVVLPSAAILLPKLALAPRVAIH